MHPPKVLYHPGSVKKAGRREDGFFASDPFFGVTDGASAPFDGEPLYFGGGLSGGAKTSRIIEDVFHQAPHLWSLQRVIREEASRQVRRFQEKAGIRLTEELSGATFAFAKIGENEVEILQAGDCFALVALRSGEIRITENQVRSHDNAMNAKIQEIMTQIASSEYGLTLSELDDEQLEKVQAAMWKPFTPTLKKARRQDVNNPDSPRGYGFLNGQSVVERMWREITLPRNQVELLLLFSDGMVPWERMKELKDEEVANWVYETYKQGDLWGLLSAAREVEAGTVSYTKHAEATAIAIEF